MLDTGPYRAAGRADLAGTLSAKWPHRGDILPRPTPPLDSAPNPRVTGNIRTTYLYNGFDKKYTVDLLGSRRVHKPGWLWVAISPAEN